MAEEQPTSRPELDDIKAFEHVIYWLRGERNYTIGKFGTDKDRQHFREWEDHENGWGHWSNQLDNYYHRAWVLGFNTEVGKQALAKFVSTAVGMLSAGIQEYGELPKPGVPSGEIETRGGSKE